MRKKILVTIISIALLVVFFIGWRVYLSRQYDDPDNFANVPVSTEDTHDWKIYRNEHFGFEIKYPSNYFLARTSNFNHASKFGHISLRKDTASAEECKTAGKRIGLHIYRLGHVTGISFGGHPIKLAKETTVADIAQQFLKYDKRKLVRRTCHRRDINGSNILICIIRAPGEMPFLSGGIFQVFVLGVYEMKNGERILVQMSNNAGGTPYTRDRALRRDVLRVFHTFRWTAHKTH